MNEGILGAIANPQLADVKGALDYRRSQMDKDEAKRKELRMNQLIAQAIPNMAEDSPLREIAQTDPQKFAMMAKVLNIPLNEGERFEQLRSRVGQLSALAESDPREAYQYAQRIQAENQRNGIQDANLDKWLQTVDKDPVTGFNALHVMNQSLNPVKADVITAKDKAELALREREVAVKERDSRNGGGAGETPASLKEIAYFNSLPEGPQKEAVGRKIGMISKEGEKLSAFAEKAIADSADAANASRSSAARYTTLADNLRNATKMSGGIKGTWGEWIKEQTGNQDELTALRKEALGITNSEAIASLPPGPATDRDIEMAKAPFPTEKSDPKYVADWLSAVSRLQQKKAEYAEFKADFISKNGTVRGDGKSLSSAWKESQKQAQPASRFKIEVSD